MTRDALVQVVKNHTGRIYMHVQATRGGYFRVIKKDVIQTLEDLYNPDEETGLTWMQCVTDLFIDPVKKAE